MPIKAQTEEQQRAAQEMNRQRTIDIQDAVGAGLSRNESLWRKDVSGHRQIDKFFDN